MATAGGTIPARQILVPSDGDKATGTTANDTTAPVTALTGLQARGSMMIHGSGLDPRPRKTITLTLAQQGGKAPFRAIATGVQSRTPAQKSRRINRKQRKIRLQKLAGVTGLEPATSAVTGQRSEPIELHPRVWTAGKSAWAMTWRQPPLVHGLPAKARLPAERRLVGAKGLEPLTPSV